MTGLAITLVVGLTATQIIAVAGEPGGANLNSPDAVAVPKGDDRPQRGAFERLERFA